MPTSLANLVITDTFATWVNKINNIVATINTIQTEGAPQLATARTIALSGAATGSASFDGSKDITITTTLANSGVTAGSYGLSANVTPADGATFNVPFIAVNAKGLVTSAKTCTVKLPTNVGTADKLTTARSVQVDLASTSADNFDGSADITPGVTGTLGTKNGGTGRTDGKAVALATKHTIDGTQFDGSANITHYGTCSTAAGTAAKTVALSGFVLGTGARVQVKFTNANTNTSATLNVNNTGAKAIYDQNGKITADAIKANGLYEFVYDGTYWRMLNGGGTTYAEGISEAFRKSWIGVPRWWRSTTLPPNHCWANGDFVEFADWPELKEVYDAGGFEGMLMAYNANSSTQAANLGKWRPDAAKPTGLYTPNLSEQFLRAWAQSELAAGGFTSAGLPGLSGAVHIYGVGMSSATGAFSVTSSSGSYRGGDWQNPAQGTLNLNASASNDAYGSSDTVVPNSVALPFAIYLGSGS